MSATQPEDFNSFLGPGLRRCDPQRLTTQGQLSFLTTAGGQTVVAQPLESRRQDMLKKVMQEVGTWQRHDFSF